MSRTVADPHQRMTYRRCGRSDLALSTLSLGMWTDLAAAPPVDEARRIVLRAVERGVTHLDLAGVESTDAPAVETMIGGLLAGPLASRRHELVLSVKSGAEARPGAGGSPRNVLASMDAALGRLGVDHVDVFYSRRFDAATPLAETMTALQTAVAAGRTRFVGISSYSATRTRQALAVAAEVGLPLVVHQPSYSMVNRWVEQGSPALVEVLHDAGVGLIAFSPLAQDLLTEERAARPAGPAPWSFPTPENLQGLRALADVAHERGQSLSQMAIAWVLRDPRVASALVGPRSVAQLEEHLGALDGPAFTPEELERIDRHAQDAGVNLLAARSSLL